MDFFKNKYNLFLFLTYALILSSFYWISLNKEYNILLYIFNSSLCFIIYLLIYKINKNKTEISLPVILFISIALRLILFNVNPVTSDDHYRYLWDGKVQQAGINPYQYAPSELTQLHDEFIYPSISFPEVKTIYPPVSQMLFNLASFISSENVSGLKFIYLFLDTGIIIFLFFVIRNFKLNTNNILLYSLSPLILFEFFINVHIDILILFFLSGFIFFAIKNLPSPAFFFLSLSVLSKTYSLIFLPVYILYLYRVKTGAKKITVHAFFFVMPFTLLAFYGESVLNIFDTMKNYMQHWYFNNLFYLMINSLQKFTGLENHLITRFALILITAAVFILILKSGFTLVQKLYLVSFSYLFFFHTVHPWYVTLLVMFIPVTLSYSALFWSGFIVMTNITVYLFSKTKIWDDVIPVLIIEFVLLTFFISRDIKTFSKQNRILNE